MTKFIFNSSGYYSYADTQPIKTPKTLYKYLPSKYAYQLVNDGVIRVSPISEYTDKKYKSSPGILDEKEGMLEKLLISREQNVTLSNKDLKNSTLDCIFTTQSSANKQSKVIFSGIDVIETHSEPNYLIYSLSSVYSESLYDEFNADVCVKVRSPIKFFSYLNKSLIKHAPMARNGKLDKCYYSRNMNIQDQNAHPALCKEPAYSHQNEWRAIWRIPHNTKQESIIIKCSRLSRIIEICGKKT